MPRLTPPTHPQALRRLSLLGDRLRSARLRRKMTQAMLAERVGVTRQTILKLEEGNPATSLATVLRVLAVLGMGADIDLLAADDTLGRSLQDNDLTRAPPDSSLRPTRAASATARSVLARKPVVTAPRAPKS